MKTLRHIISEARWRWMVSVSWRLHAVLDRVLPWRRLRRRIEAQMFDMWGDLMHRIGEIESMLWQLDADVAELDRIIEVLEEMQWREDERSVVPHQELVAAGYFDED